MGHSYFWKIENQIKLIQNKTKTKFQINHILLIIVTILIGHNSLVTVHNFDIVSGYYFIIIIIKNVNFYLGDLSLTMIKIRKVCKFLIETSIHTHIQLQFFYSLIFDLKLFENFVFNIFLKIKKVMSTPSHL